MSNLILIVEDEQKLASLLVDYLALEQYQSHCLYDGADVVNWVKSNKPNAILLDLMLPVKDGMQLCKEIRSFSDVPILMMTAKVEEIDRLIGLEMGADDYICKPYSPREVVARVKAVLRRANSNHIGTSFKLDLDTYQVHFGGKRLDLTAVEFQLLKPLSEEPGRIFTRDQLMQNMYADNRIVSDRTIDSHIKKLRKKLLALSEEQEFIQSVYGVGYRFSLSR